MSRRQKFRSYGFRNGGRGCPPKRTVIRARMAAAIGMKCSKSTAWQLRARQAVPGGAYAATIIAQPTTVAYYRLDGNAQDELGAHHGTTGQMLEVSAWDAPWEDTANAHGLRVHWTQRIEHFEVDSAD